MDGRFRIADHFVRYCQNPKPVWSTRNSGTMKSKYFPALDGLRCVAIGLVMLAHANFPHLSTGGIGVDLFFVLSGFLITSILLSEFQRYGSINYKNFYARRFLRLIPCLVVVVIGVAIEKRVVTGSWPFMRLLPAIGYVMNWAKIYVNGKHLLLGHTWSLAVEEQFYLIWPLLILLTCTWIRSPRKRLAFFLALAAGLSIYRTLMVPYYSGVRIYFGSDTHSDGLVLGAAVAFFVAILPEGRLPDSASRVVAYVFTPLALIALCVVLASWDLWSPPMGRVGFTLVAVASAVLVLDLVAGSHSLLQWLLCLAPAVWIGRISYGLYLWHLPIYHTLDDLHVPDRWVARLAIGGPLSVGVAALSFYTVEKRFLKLKSQFARKPDAALPVAPAPADPPDLANVALTGE
jgi:peptidoglycan/LPS O-acetylase OafA/YrhL